MMMMIMQMHVLAAVAALVTLSTFLPRDAMHNRVLCRRPSVCPLFLLALLY